MRGVVEREPARESAWLTPREAASYLGVGVDEIYDLCATGGLTPVKIRYRTIRVRRDNRTSPSVGEQQSRGSGQRLSDFLLEWKTHSADEYRLAANRGTE